jgi:acyl dehydratase
LTAPASALCSTTHFTEGTRALDAATTKLFNVAGAVPSRALFPNYIPEISRMSADQFSVPIDQRYFEDYIPGSAYEYGPISVSEAEIIEFAEKFDTQYIHTDREKAAQGPFGGLIASGWHTASLMMRLYSDHFISSVAAIASPGVDELRWIKPVRPGDSLRIRVTVIESRRSQSKPQIGMVRVLVEVFNQQDEIVMTLKPMNLLRCRNTSK